MHLVAILVHLQEDLAVLVGEVEGSQFGFVNRRGSNNLLAEGGEVVGMDFYRNHPHGVVLQKPQQSF